MTVPPADAGPQPGPDPYGAPNGPHRHRRGPGRAAIVTAVVAAVLAIAAIAAIWLAVDDGDEEATVDDDTTGPSPAETSPTETEPETTGPPPAEDAVGRCLPLEPRLTANEIDLSTPCDGEDAFWTVTAAADDPDGTVDDEGGLADVGTALEVCGDQWGAFRPGQAWTHWFFTYDTLTSRVEELYCVEAIADADDDGRTPVTPDIDDCFDDSERWWTVPCDAEAAQYRVTDTVAVDPPERLRGDAADAAAEACESGELYWQLMDVEGRTTDILCGDEI